MVTTITALDIGTTKTCALIGELNEAGGIRILGAGVAPSRGLRKGVVTDVKEASQGITEAVEQAQRVAGIGIAEVYVGIAGAHIQSTNSRGVAAINNGQGVIQDDIDRALEAAEAIAVPSNREILHTIPRSFILDGQEGVKDPLGMAGIRLEVEAHIVTGASASIQNLVKAVEATGLKCNALLLEPIASGYSALTKAEKEMGVVLADIGGGTTDIAIFIDGSIWHTLILPIGGIYITNDIAIGIRAPFPAAEEIKIRYGHVDPGSIPEAQVVDVRVFGDEGRRSVSRREIAEIIRARVEEICQLVLTEVKRSGYDNLLPAGVVLCGGTAELAGIQGLARQTLQMPVRIGSPLELDGYSDRVSSPAFATSVGLLRWGLEESFAKLSAPSRNGHHKPSSFGKLFTWAKHAFLPEK